MIAPAAVVGNWAAEAARFAPELRVVVHHGASRPRPSELAEASRRGRHRRHHVRHGGPRHRRARRHRVAQRSSSTRRRRSRTRRATPPSSCVASRPAPGWRSPARRSRTASATSGRSSTSPIPGSSEAARRSSPQMSGDGETALRALNGILLFRRTKSEPEVAAELPDKIDELDHCTMTARADRAVPGRARRTRARRGRRRGRGRAEEGRDPGGDHRAQADLQPPGRLPRRRTAARRTLRQADPPRGDRRLGLRGRRADPDLHPLRHLGAAPGRPPHRGHRDPGRLLRRQPQPRPPATGWSPTSRTAKGRARWCCR